MEFDRVYSHGKRFNTPLVQLIAANTDSFHGSVVVGKKVYKHAVDRNTLRRQMYAILYTWSRTNPKPRTYIIIAKPAAKNASFTILKNSLTQVLEDGVHAKSIPQSL